MLPSTQGKNPEKVSERLVNFLEFVKADAEKSKEEFEDPFVRRLQKTIEKIKHDREMRERFMIFQEMLTEERDATETDWGSNRFKSVGQTL